MDRKWPGGYFILFILKFLKIFQCNSSRSYEPELGFKAVIFSRLFVEHGNTEEVEVEAKKIANASS